MTQAPPELVVFIQPPCVTTALSLFLRMLLIPWYPVMARIHSYLSFNGNCLQAMNFYQQCFGGELLLQTFGNTPLSETLPAASQELILHAMLQNDDLVLMASDATSEEGVKPGNNVALMLNCSSEEQMRDCYQKLAEEATDLRPIERTYWGAWFGDLTDRFGNHWMLYFDEGKS